MTEHADAFRQDDAVDAVLQSVVLAPDVKLAEGILRDLRHLQHDLVEQRIVPSRHLRNGRGVDGVGTRAGLSLYVRTHFVQVLGGHHDRGQRQLVGRLRRIGGRLRARRALQAEQEDGGGGARGRAHE